MATAALEQSDTLRPWLARTQRIALIAGGVFLALAVIGAFTNTQQFFESYLFAYIYWFAFGMGSLGLLMLQHTTGGRWGYVLSRSLEAGALTLVPLAVLFLPILFGLSSLYEWARPEEVAKSAALQHKAAYLNPAFFSIRAVIYFAIWIGLAYILTRWSTQLDRKPDERLVNAMKRLSPVGLVIFVLTMTLAAVDWGMSLEPEWFSSIYGVIYMVGQALSTMCLNIILLWQLSAFRPIKDVATRDRFHDLGKLTLAFVALWMYTTYSQYIIMWAGNLPEDTPWYYHRNNGGWEVLPPIIVAGQFALPLLLLFSRRLKRQPAALASLAIFILVIHAIDVFWLIMPAFYPDGLTISWINLAAFFGIGGLWLGSFFWLLARQPLLPLNDPRRGMAFHNPHAHHSEGAAPAAAHH